MTKKDFIATAKILSGVNDKETRDQLSLDFSLYFKDQNEKFNTQVFIKACQPPST
jgi:hypothetical protein|tara:strand:- start:7677 stop:7841 length:165 start_codon:yes stop_codon:yes gene_type:complete